MNAIHELHDLRNKIKLKLPGATGADPALLNDLDMQASAFENPHGNQQQSLPGLNNSFAYLLHILQQSDTPPTTQTIDAAKELGFRLKQLLSKWDKIKRKWRE